jgi:hypothetical protein
MARTSITPVALVGPYPTLPVSANALDIALTAADVANKNQAAQAGSRQLLVAFNSGATPHTVTITSAADDKNRTGDLSAYSVGAGELAAFLMKSGGWRQSDSKLYFEADHAEIKFAVINID